jgi:hypothetical protein
METKSYAKEEATEILRQLGGNRFSLMTGAKNFSCSSNEKGNTKLSFKIGRNVKNINHVEIVLNGLDLYDIDFLNLRLVSRPTVELKKKVISQHKNIYCEQLKEIFEASTGLHTSL